jgi:Zn-dependent peptidase ImmA (M78 family)
MNHYQHLHNTSPSVLASLRSLVPQRTLRRSESLRIAELQAARFRHLTNSPEPAIRESVIAALPRIRIERRDLPTSGMSYWNGDCWVIALNDREPLARQRFTLMHEYKHILDHGSAERLYGQSQTRTAGEQAEQAADYFAGCVLMPKTLVKQAWAQGNQTLTALSELFQVSPRAVEVRLSQIGLIEPTPRCAPPARVWRPESGRFYRQLHPLFATEGVAA